jgi:hypothetical protein
MTRKQAYWLTAIGILLTAGLVVWHLAMPIGGTWLLNRVLHYVWEGVVGAGAAGAVAWLLLLKAKARRRDQDRENARRRLIGMAVVVIAAVCLIIFAEVHRQLEAQRRLEAAAIPDLQALGSALAAYEADHGGARPATLADLVPKYVETARLYCAYRNGPAAAPPPAALAKEGEAPSYVLAREPPLPPDVKRRGETRLLIYLRPGCAWAPLTAVLEKDGRCHVTGDDIVRTFEKQIEPYK